MLDGHFALVARRKKFVSAMYVCISRSTGQRLQVSRSECRGKLMRKHAGDKIEHGGEFSSSASARVRAFCLAPFSSVSSLLFRPSPPLSLSHRLPSLLLSPPSVSLFLSFCLGSFFSFFFLFFLFPNDRSRRMDHVCKTPASIRCN